MTIMDYAKKTINKNKKKRKSVSTASHSSGRGRSARGKSSSNRTVLSPMLLMVLAVAVIFGTAIYYVDNLTKILDVSKLSEISKISKKIEDFKLAKKSPEKGKEKEKLKVIKEKKINTDLAVKSPKFEFYHTLPKMSVEVNNPLRNQTPVDSVTIASKKNQLEQPALATIVEDLANLPKNSNSNSNSSSSSNSHSTNNSGSYVLQIASFKDLNEAEELRAKLILNGFDVTVQTVKLPSGVVWHRVKSTKLDNLMLAENLHNQFKSHNIQSIIISEKG